MRSVHSVLTALVLAFCLLTVPAASDDKAADDKTTAGDPLIYAEETFEVSPLPGHGRDSGPLQKRVVDERPAREHGFLPSAEMRRLKDNAMWSWSDDRRPATALEGQALTKNGPRPLVPTATSSFDGLNRLDSGHRGFLFLPPDTIVAAGPNHILEGTNVAARLTNRAGGNPVVRSLYSLFGHNLPAVMFDPKFYYDRLSGRFFMVALFQNENPNQSFVYLAVSRSSTPRTLNVPADWCSYRIQGRVGESWADYPGLGMNENYIAISTNNFNFTGGFRSAYLTALDKAPLVNNANRCPNMTVRRFKLAQDAFGSVAFTVQPAQHYSTNNSEGTPLYLVSSQPVATSSRYTFWRLFDRAGESAPVISRQQIETNENYSIPPEALQNGGSPMDSGDLRIQQAVFRNGTVWAVHGTTCNFGSLPAEACVRVLGIEPNNGGETVTYDETIGGGDGWYYWMPGVAVNANDDVMITYQRSHATLSVGVGFASKLNGAADFTGNKLINGRCGIDNFDGNTNRTGDYVGIQTDPVDNNSFWIAGEYSATVGRRACDWRTRIARVLP